MAFPDSDEKKNRKKLFVFFRIDHQIASVASGIVVKSKLISYLDPISSSPAKFRLGDATRTPLREITRCWKGAKSGPKRVL